MLSAASNVPPASAAQIKVVANSAFIVLVSRVTSL
jgi:hypothetical protein